MLIDLEAVGDSLELSADSFSFLLCFSSFSFLIVSLRGFSGSGAGSGVTTTGVVDVVGTGAAVGTGTSSSSESSITGFFLRLGVELPRRDRSKMSISRSSRMFSSGSQVLCRVLQPFHLTRYSTLPCKREEMLKCFVSLDSFFFCSIYTHCPELTKQLARMISQLISSICNQKSSQNPRVRIYETKQLPKRLKKGLICLFMRKPIIWNVRTSEQ